MSRVGIVYPRANIDTVPSLVAAVEEFARTGYAVDVFAYTQAGQPEPTFDSPRVHLRSLGVEGLVDHSTAGLRRLAKRVLPSSARAPLRFGYRALAQGLARGSRAAVRTAVLERTEPYACMIGVDPDGLVLARQLADGAPLGYFSLELLLSAETTTTDERALKAKERELSRRAAFVVVQDQARAHLLAQDNGIDPERLVLVPNAPPGPARRQPSRFWHDRFELPETTRVVLHSGSLGDWTGVEAIVQSACDWPEPWALVVHTRYDAASSAYVDGLRASADPNRVHFSLKPVPRQDYEPLIDGADAGLAFYVAVAGSSFTGMNVETIGLSSGKLAYYLRAGLPVVVNQSASIAERVESFGCGLGVNDATGIAAALEDLDADHDAHSLRALEFFDQYLDPRPALRQLVARVAAL
ncbi:MAG TPA: hypothetical protein VFG86_19575 [Chloroflexota bacterium]|nr:hypothetical protein [Chloroflexota bacterium]